MDEYISLKMTFLYLLINLPRIDCNTSETCCIKSRTLLDCTKCNLSLIPMSLIDNNTSELILDNNNISRIPDGILGNFPALKKLSLTDNPLQLNNETFRGLASLEHLAVGSTNMETPPLLFGDTLTAVSGIKSLHLYYTYPTELNPRCLRPLKNLETLMMALTQGAILEDDFRHLKKLESLRIVHLRNTSIHSVNSETFSAVPQLAKLEIIGALKSMAPDALSVFTNLSSLKLLCNIALPITDVAEAIANMRGPMLTTLVLDGSDNLDFYYLTPDLFNSSNYANITHLSLKHTHMGAIDPYIMYKLPKLKYLSIGFNAIMTTRRFGSGYAVWQSINMANVESFDVSYLYQRTIPEFFHDHYCVNSENTFRAPPSFIKPPANIDLTRTYVPSGDFMKLYMPPSLLYLYANHLGWLILRMKNRPLVVNDNNILYFDLSSSNMEHLPPVRGFKKLQGIDLSNNRLQFLYVDQLFYFPCLTHLYLGNNNLGSMNLTGLFAGGSQLEWLDMSYNSLNKLPTLLLVNLTSLEHVSFRGNPLASLVLDLQENLKLRMLDASGCSLTNLTNTFRQELDDLQSNVNHTLSLNVSDNRFECSCATLEMIRWFRHTNVNIIDREFVHCKYRNASKAIYFVNYEELLKECNRRNSILTVTILVPVGILSVMALMMILVYHFRWQLRWHIYKFRRVLRHLLLKTKDKSHPQISRKYNAFVSHNHNEDFEWVIKELRPVVEEQWGLKLCLGQRDFIPGKPIVENIVDAIDNSSKTILVITPAFAASEWCEFEMQMAIIKGRRDIIIIYKEEVPIDKVSKTLRVLLKSINYIEYSRDPAGAKVFWQRLRTCLKEQSAHSDKL